MQAQDTITEITTKRIYTSKHPQDPGYPQFIVYSKSNNFQLGFGGYAKLTAAFDFNGVVDSYDFITYDIPVGDVDLKEKRLYLDAHQSRIYVEVLGHIRGKPMRIYIETDFYSENYYPRLRHAYGQFGGFLIGQTWSTLMDLDAMPNTVDFEGPNSAVSLRAPMIRYSHNFGKGFKLSAAIELPEVSISYIPPFTSAPQYIPDVIMTARFSSKFGHIQFGGVLRTMTLKDTLNDHYSNNSGFGGTLSWLFKITKKDNFMGQFVVGKGIAKYVQDISGVGMDMAQKYYEQELISLSSLGFYVGYQHHWNQKLNSTFTYGFTRLKDNYYLENQEEFKRSHYASANLFWKVQSFMTVALEYLWGQRRNSGGEFGRANRLNAMVQFFF